MKTPILLVQVKLIIILELLPCKTERYFQALKVLMLQHEWYSAKKALVMPNQNILHLLWEQDQFLNI
jgi:hypothetical protein